MTKAIKRTFSMRPDVDRMLVAHVERTPGATLSSTVNAALVDYLETAALVVYRHWELEASAEERAALAAFSAHDEASWAAESDGTSAARSSTSMTAATSSSGRLLW